MKKKTVIAIVLCALLAAVHVAHATQPQGKKQQGKAAPVDSSQQLADRIVNSQVPVVIDFWAAWCMPCRFLDPIIEDLEKDYKGKALFMKVDIDLHRGISSYFKVNSVPLVYIVEDKTVRTVVRGVQPKAAYIKAIDDALKLAADRKAEPPAATKQPTEQCKNC